jgi:hypothetical protein
LISSSMCKSCSLFILPFFKLIHCDKDYTQLDSGLNCRKDTESISKKNQIFQLGI